jgi:hypothetical protein
MQVPWTPCYTRQLAGTHNQTPPREPWIAGVVEKPSMQQKLGDWLKMLLLILPGGPYFSFIHTQLLA